MTSGDRSLSRGWQLAMLLAATTVAVAAQSRPAHADASPYVAVVMCEDSYDWSWDDTHASAQGVVGLAGLVGVPYETVTLSELLALPTVDFTALWFSQCPVLTDDNYAAVDALLVDYVGAGGNVFLDGGIGIYRPDPQGMFGVSYRGTDSLSTTLKVIDGGWFPTAGYAITTADSDHPIANRMGIAADTEISQGLIDGVETMDLTSVLDPDGAILLEITSADDPLSYPFLVATLTDGGGRVVAIASYGNYVGPASAFHNEAPNVYYDNQVLPYLLEALHWMEHRSGEPMVGLQLSHAPMTAVGRLDGDWSNEPEATELTFLYLIDAARTTGLASVYGVVSDFVPDGGWQRFHDGGMFLERYGGALGSHSHTHNDMMSGNLDEAGWATETVDSLAMIKTMVTDEEFAPDVDAYINPGDTIEQGDYYRFFDAVELYMSHGFETTVPYSSGVYGFNHPVAVEPTAIVNDTPAPDFQWLYLEEWVYTVDQATEIQGQILNYYQNTVRRGVLYNQMWHDYAIGGALPPLNFPDADSVRPLFDVNIAHFTDNQVYMPSIDEVVGKFHTAKHARHTSARAGDTITVDLDYTAVPAGYRGHVSGMGLRINRAGGTIQAVTVDGADHPAFTNDTVILPAASGTSQQVVVEIGPAPGHPRLAFSSKPIGNVSVSGGALSFGWADTSTTRKGCVTGPETTVLLGADSYLRASASSLCATIPYDSSTNQVSTTEIDAGLSEFFVDGATRAIESASLSGLTVTMQVAAGETGGELTLRSGGPPERVTIDGEPVGVSYRRSGFALPVPTAASTVVIELPECADADSDGITDCAGDCDESDPEIGRCDPPGGCCDAGSGGGVGRLLLVAAVALLVTRRRRVRTPGSAGPARS